MKSNLLHRRLLSRRNLVKHSALATLLAPVIRKMDALATKLGPWDPVKVIRGFRNTRYRAPRRAPAQVRERRRG